MNPKHAGDSRVADQALIDQVRAAVVDIKANTFGPLPVTPEEYEADQQFLRQWIGRAWRLLEQIGEMAGSDDGQGVRRPVVISDETMAEIARVQREWPDGIHTCEELQRTEPGRRPCTCGRCGTTGRACFYCGKVLMAIAGFVETVRQPDGERRDFCSAECLHWQLHEDEKL